MMMMMMMMIGRCHWSVDIHALITGIDDCKQLLFAAAKYDSSLQASYTCNEVSCNMDRI